jgi:sigma-B regulation protein RsbU (phosphoserine phosphatase)
MELSLKERFKPYIALPSTALFLAGLLMCAPLLQGVLTSLVDATSYIVWHTTFEFSSIIIAICIFCVAYYSFEQNQNFRYLFLGSMLLLMGFIDFFHTLSYKGMPDFLVSYSTSNRATTFWIIARLTGGFGLLVSSLIPPQINRRVNKSIYFNTTHFVKPGHSDTGYILSGPSAAHVYRRRRADRHQDHAGDCGDAVLPLCHICYPEWI